MTTYSPFELEPIFIDFKNESYNLGLDIQANQNDTLTLNFICRNNGIEEDMSKYKIELRVHNNNSNTDYIQTQNENVTLGTDGSVKIVCQSLKGNKLTAYSGQLNGVLRIFNTENKQKATRIITMRIVADPLETDRANICESTITKLEELDWLLDEAYNLEDEFKKAIEEAIKQKNELIKTTDEARVVNTTLEENIKTGTELNSNLVKSNKLAEQNQKELDTRNTTASQNIETLTNKNATANETIVNISEKIETGTKLDNGLGLKIPIGTTLKNDLDTNIETGTQLKTDLIELIPTVEKSKSDLDTSKINADLSNTTLTETTNNAETKKQEVVAECKVADEKIKQMSEFGDVTEVVKDVTSLKTEITTARDNETDLNTRLERDKTNILKTIGQVNVETDGDVASQLKDCAKKDKTLQTGLNAEMLGGKKVTDIEFYRGQYTENLDDLTITGVYGIVKDKTTGTPVNEWGSIIVQQCPDDKAVYQIAMIPLRITYTRFSYYDPTSNSRKWDKWKQLATSETGLLTYLNGWQGIAGNQEVVKCGNMVNIDVVLNNGSMTANSSIIQLPNGFRPNTTLYFTAKAQDSSYNSQNIGVLIYTDGRVVFDGTPSGNTRLILNHTFYSK